MKRNKHTSSAVSHTTVSAVAIGIGIAVALSAILSAVLTSLVLKASIREELTGIGVFVIRTLSVFTGGVVGAMIGKEKYLHTIGSITGGYLVIILGLGITFYDGSFRNFGIGAISALIGGVGAFLIQMRPRRKGARHIKYAR